MSIDPIRGFFTSPERRSADRLADLERQVRDIRSQAAAPYAYFERDDEEATGSTSYVSLGDEVEVELASNGLVEVLYRADWKSTVLAQGAVALFVDDVEVLYNTSAHATPQSQWTSSRDRVQVDWRPLQSTQGRGILPVHQPSRATAGGGDALSPAWTSNQIEGVALGGHRDRDEKVFELVGGAWTFTNLIAMSKEPLGGWIQVPVAAGRHTVGVRYKGHPSPATVSVKNRRLWARTSAPRTAPA